MAKKFTVILVMALVSGCAGMKVRDLPEAYHAQAILILAEAGDEILGCPLGITEALGDRLSKGSCQKEVVYEAKKKTH